MYVDRIYHTKRDFNDDLCKPIILQMEKWSQRIENVINLSWRLLDIHVLCICYFIIIKCNLCDNFVRLVLLTEICK